MFDEKYLNENGYNVTAQQTKDLNEHYNDPKNRWALKEYNARGVGRNPNNHGQVDMYLMIDNDKKIEDIGYEFNGCPTISFSASIFTEDIKGLSLDEAFEMTQTSIDEVITKDNCEECTTMILLAFLASFENYQNRQNGKDEEFSIKMIGASLEHTQLSCG